MCLKKLRNYLKYGRAVARSKNLGWHALLGGDNVPPPLDEIGLTDLSKYGGIAPLTLGSDSPNIHLHVNCIMEGGNEGRFYNSHPF